jgi:hypothetical protein
LKPLLIKDYDVRVIWRSEKSTKAIRAFFPTSLAKENPACSESLTLINRICAREINQRRLLGQQNTWKRL